KEGRYSLQSLEMLLSRWSRCLKPFSHLLKRYVIDFAAGIPLTEYLYCRGLEQRGSGMISDYTYVFLCEPAEKCPHKYREQGYPDKRPKQGDHPPKKVRTKWKHKRLSFLVIGITLTENVILLYRYSLFFKTHALTRTSPKNRGLGCPVA